MAMAWGEAMKKTRLKLNLRRVFLVCSELNLYRKLVRFKGRHTMHQLLFR